MGETVRPVDRLLSRLSNRAGLWRFIRYSGCVLPLPFTPSDPAQEAPCLLALLAIRRYFPDRKSGKNALDTTTWPLHQNCGFQCQTPCARLFEGLVFRITMTARITDDGKLTRRQDATRVCDALQSGNNPRLLQRILHMCSPQASLLSTQKFLTSCRGTGHACYTTGTPPLQA